MWTRAELKTSAKGVLRKYYGYGLLAYLIYGAIVGIPIAIIEMITMFNVETSMLRSTPLGLAQNNASAFSTYKTLYTSGVMPLMYLVILVLTIFLILPLVVGLYKCFLSFRENKVDLSESFHAFKNGNYLHVVGAMAWETLFRFLWTLLFIIPGIIKMFAYSMVPFILADNPKIGYRRALKLSMAMTQGQKGKIFVLMLSFIWWFLLGFVACCGIGEFFLMPYITATFAELYIKLRQNALENGFCTPEELNLKAVPAAPLPAM